MKWIVRLAWRALCFIEISTRALATFDIVEIRDKYMEKQGEMRASRKWMDIELEVRGVTT